MFKSILTKVTSSLFLIWLLAGCSESESPKIKSKSLGVLKLDSTSLMISELASNIDQPWEITWGSDNHIWYTLHKGSIGRINPESFENRILLNIPDVHYEKSRGLLSMILHPDFPEEPFLFVHYTYMDSVSNQKQNIRSKLVRYRYDPVKITLSEPVILLENIPGTTYHNGSRMVVTDDEKILLTTGDAGNKPGSQDLNVLSGKILRIKLDGTIPDDNPWDGSYVYSYGHRNAQGITQANGLIYSSEHGPLNDDELNLIQAGGNYGWPNVEGKCNNEQEKAFCEEFKVIEPLMSWTPTIAVSGLDYYDHPAIPEWRNSLLMTTLKSQSLRAFPLSKNGLEILEEKIYLQRVFGRIRDLCISPNGEVFLATSNTDWHPKSQVWMYDSLPNEGYDKIIKLSVLKESEVINQVVLKEDSIQFSLPTENWNLTVDTNIPGGRLYIENCASCHLPSGEGIEDLIPPLTDPAWILDNDEDLIQTTLWGLSGEIEVNKATYNQEMPGFANSLNDHEIAEILTFVKSRFGGDDRDISEDLVSKERKRGDFRN